MLGKILIFCSNSRYLKDFKVISRMLDQYGDIPHDVVSLSAIVIAWNMANIYEV